MTGENIIGILKSNKWDTAADKIYVVGAHYDTSGDSDGVDNNGSGVVAMIALMKRLQQKQRDQGCDHFSHSVIFVAFDLQLREHVNYF